MNGHLGTTENAEITETSLVSWSPHHISVTLTKSWESYLFDPRIRVERNWDLFVRPCFVRWSSWRINILRRLSRGVNLLLVFGKLLVYGLDIGTSKFSIIIIKAIKALEPYK